ncbi:hypothetical protein KFE25_012056 [Diacronema lutheri]|uniref:DNA damage-binding protein 1 n=2 Tax=Diacronema lutheri TaxID=2081491 RepID=A0A8J5X6L9_DIALT|nr:hypothetical protein KFE25_012056 [Diacronema lutheri]
MHLYALTLQRATAITAAIHGNFSAPKVQEIVVARGKLLELLRPDDAGKLQSVHVHEVFGIVRSIQPFRLLGGNRDYIVVGSDSGKITVLEFRADAGAFVRVHCETFGKSGCRRIVPGEFLAVDPRGRAVMIGACEKQKLVYTLNRDSSANLTISSPLEAHKAHTLCFALVGVDVGFENPIFAALEVDYDEVEEASAPADAAAGLVYTKLLTHYEFDLGLNTVTRKWSDPVDPTANLLVALPGGDDGPGGVLVCSESFVTFRAPGHPERRCLLPRRRDMPADHGLLVVSHALHRQKDLFFVLLHTELGDVLKVSVAHTGAVVSEVVVRYFDTLPTSVALVILRTGFLFAASEAGNHTFYQFQGVGDDDELPAASSTQLEGVALDGEVEAVLIEPRALRNLVLVDEVDNFAPLTELRAADVTREGSVQLCALCGRGPRSTVRVLRHGLAVAELAVSELPGTPTAVWTVRTSAAAEYDSFIVVSFVNATLVLSIGETVEEVTDSGLLGSVATLSVQLLDGDSLCQVHAGGLRHVRAGRPISEWRAPAGKPVTRASANARQVLVALSGGELIYFELDALNNLVVHDKKELGQDASCVDLAAVPAGRQRARFAAVGTWDNYVRLIALDPDDCMQVVAMKALPAPVESAALLDSAHAGLGASTLVLAIGLSNGVLMRTSLDAQSGELNADTTTIFCGARAVGLSRVQLGGRAALLALSSRPWAAYAHNGRLSLAPLSYDALDAACSFRSEQCAEGIVAVAGSTLRIFSPERLGEVFHARTLQARYTPRRMAVHPSSGLLVVVESDHHAYGEALKARVYAEAGVNAAALLPSDAEPPPEPDDADDARVEPPLAEAVVGVPRAPDGRWASCVRVLDCASGAAVCVLELPDNEAAFCVAAVPFKDMGGEHAIVVGSVRDLALHPRSLTAGYLRVYRLVGTAGAAGSASLELLHETPTEDVPYALAPFHGRLLAGVGRTLRLYELGKKRLLRRCEARNLPVLVQSVHVLSAERVVVGDLAHSFHWLRYRPDENSLATFADGTTPRWLTAACALDVGTVAGADKFGNVLVSRLGEDAEAETVDVGSAADGYLGGAPVKAEEIVQYHVGELVVSLQKQRLSAASHECVLFATNMGGIGALLPVRSRDDIDFLKHLEMHMRQEAPPLCGRDHMFFRSAFFPVKDVTDGDLCEQFASLPMTAQRSIAHELDRTPSEVLKKLDDLRNSVL